VSLDRQCSYNPSARPLAKLSVGELRQRVETCSSDIGRLSELRFARLVPAASTKGYQYLMSMVFEDKADLANYMPHPIHPALAKWCADRGCEFLFFDYDLDTATSIRQPG
jgi:hypothetical protein